MGKIQSRKYQKKMGEEEVITKTAYEVSISKLEHADDIEEESDKSVENLAE
ncbi:single-strand DNA binding protein [Clostridium botulinum C str. Eklund]|nr:single-strand DNA binding protein [Clostridium botulinum C str. Eklund]